MKTRPFIEISAVFALAAVAATLTTCATPAYAQPINNDDFMGNTDTRVFHCTTGGAFAYPVITCPHGNVRIGVLKSTAQLPRLNAVLFCVHGLSVMTGCVGVSCRAVRQPYTACHP
jgi:hypothetical protein